MRYDNTKLREMLAAEYALGTLRGAARRRFEALCASRRDWQQSTDWWLHRIHLLADTAPGVKPPRRVWRNIEIRLYGSHVSSAIGWWRAIALGSSLATVVLAFILSSSLLRPTDMQDEAPPASIALLADEQARAGWILSLGKKVDGKTEIRVATTASVTAVPGKSFELWVLPPGNSAPISLGLLPEAGNGLIGVDASIAILLADSGLAVSLEPEGGSPSGQPTGPVLYQGKLTQI